MYTDLNERQRIFGTAWDKIIDIFPELGGFIVDHEHKSVYMDNNALALNGIKNAPDYDGMLVLLKKTGNNDQSKRSLKLYITEDNSSMTAGVFRFMGAVSSVQSSGFSVCTQEQLMADMADHKGKSLLALVQLHEKSGIKVTDVHIFSALSAIFSNAPAGTLVSMAAEHRFWIFVPDFSEDAEDFLRMLRNNVEKCAAIAEFGNDLSGEHGLTFCAGCAADTGEPAVRMRTAEFTLVDAVSKGKGSICIYSSESFEKHKNEYDLFRRFYSLIDNNSFSYHFQPIVSAVTGDILAYEALMRTDSSISMNPLEILETAAKLGRLYDIEKATISNTLDIISKSRDIFVDRSLFVNAIPAHILSSADWKMLEMKYGNIMDKMVIELTEQSEIDDDSLGIIKDRLRRNNIKIAIDDYGSGYSNTTNLLRYSPQVVKLDRSLISGIDKKPKIQKFVKGMIEFIHLNGFEALAEGVETFDEMSTVIRLGCDLIQGYYIAKPNPVMLNEISAGIRKEIATLNLEYSGNIAKIYHPKNGETVDLGKLADEHYSTVFIDCEEVSLLGRNDERLSMNVIVKDELTTKISLTSVSLTTLKDEALINIGTGCRAEICLNGDNELQNRGIWVPQTASLELSGSGSLHISSAMQDAYGIGVDRHNSPGNIKISGSGLISIYCACETCVAIGGGKNSGGTAVQILSGFIKINCSGLTCIGIGNFEGNSVIDMTDCRCIISMNASTSLGIGSLKGITDICCNNYHNEITLEGISICGIGVINNGLGHIRMTNGNTISLLKGRVINCIGSREGDINCNFKNTCFNITCEGSTVSGLGDYHGHGDVSMIDSNLTLSIRAKEHQALGSPHGTLTLKNITKKILINE